MLLKIGELAKRSGLSVRALHHYDEIGLLSPSQRSAGGARLYGKDDVVRLHRIEALKQFACSLADVKVALDCPDGLMETLRRQIEELQAQAVRVQSLGQHLRRLVDLMTAGGEAATSDWLNILELMNMYQKHLSNEELNTLIQPGDGVAPQTGPQWAGLAEEIRQSMRQGLSTESAQAHDLAWRWVSLLVQMTRNDPALAGKLINLQLSETRAQDILGISPAMLAWVCESLTLARCAIFAKHLNPPDAQEVRSRQLAHGKDLTLWPAMVAELRAQMLAGTDAGSAPVRDIVQRWQKYFRDSHCGDDAALESRVRAVFIAEPMLQQGIGVDDALAAYFQSSDMSHHIMPRQADAGPKPSAMMVAVQRAAHQLLEHPLVLEDPLALSILGEVEVARLHTQLDAFRQASAVGMRSSVVVRSRLANDEWSDARARGVRQCVILGAGLDTRAYYPSHHEGACIFEVDLPATQAWKLARLCEAGIEIPPSVRHVPVDFEDVSLGEGLARAGFAPQEPAFFIWLGVTMYLEERSVLETLRFIGKCAPGSAVLFDYVLPLELFPPAMQIALRQLMAMLAAQGEPWKSFFDTVKMAARLPSLGLSLGHSWSPEALNQRYLADRKDGLNLGSGPGRLMLATVPMG